MSNSFPTLLELKKPTKCIRVLREIERHFLIAPFFLRI